MDYYSPSEAAAKTGFSLDTLRYYERLGLMLQEIRRSSGGRRRFSETDVLWLRMLRCLRETGMPLAEMLRFTALVRAGEETVPERLGLLEEHDRRIEEQVAQLRERQQQIREKIGYYRSARGRDPVWNEPDTGPSPELRAGARIDEGTRM